MKLRRKTFTIIFAAFNNDLRPNIENGNPSRLFPYSRYFECIGYYFATIHKNPIWPKP